MKELIKHLWSRIVCFVSGHAWGETIRDSNITGWTVTHVTLPNNDGIIPVYRRKFSAHRFCERCQKIHTTTGYDQKPHETDPFNNAKKTASNSENDYWLRDDDGNLTKITKSEFEKRAKGKIT